MIENDADMLLMDTFVKNRENGLRTPEQQDKEKFLSFLFDIMPFYIGRSV